LFNISNQIPDFEDCEFDVVFHAAGKAHSIPKTIEEKNVFFDINEKGTKNLCAALEKSKLPSSIYFYKYCGCLWFRVWRAYT